MAKSLKSPDQQQQPGAKETTPAPVRNPYPPGFNPVVQARKLYVAMDGMGTDERAIFDVLRSGRADLNRAIETAFNQMYSGTLRSWLRGDLSGSDYTKAVQLLGRGDFTLTQKLNQAADGWGADEEKIFHALEVAPKADLAEVRNNAYLLNRLRSELNNNDYQLALAYLDGFGTLAAKLRRAVDRWGTDEEAIWRAIDKASEKERLFVLGQPSLMSHLRSDFSSDDYLRAKRMLDGTWDNVDKIEVAMKGAGTDEAMLLGAIAGLNQGEFTKIEKGTTELPNGISSLKNRLEGELSGADEYESLEALHQKQLTFDASYALKYREAQAKKLGEAALADTAGAAALMAGEGQSMSNVAQLRKACVGWGTDEESIWDVCARIPPEQGRWILKYNPENIMGMLRSDLDVFQYLKVRGALGGGAWGKILVLKNAVEGAGTNERQIYDAIDSIIAEGLGQEVLDDGHVLRQLQGDLDSRMYAIFVQVLDKSTFTPMQRLRWATARYGTDEDLVWEVCGEYGSKEWYSDGKIQPDVDEILRSELSTRDYWKAKDLIRGDPTTEQEKLERSKEMLERERSGDVSVWLVDSVSDSGQNADEAWREYQVTYNQAYEDGKVSEEEQTRLQEAEDYSNYTTEQYREAKASFAQWASQIAITIVGIVATILTAGAAAGPFIAGLAANAGTIATTMVAAAALKVGIHKAIEGEGYDLTSMDTLVDGVGAAIEGGLFVVGNLGAAKIMQGLSKSKYVSSIGPTIEKAFGSSGRRIWGAGIEGTIDGTLGGMGEGMFRGLANDKTWSGTLGDAFSNIGATTLLHTTLGGGMGMVGGSLFKSIGETFGPTVRKLLAKGTSEGMAPGSGSVDDVMVKMPDDLDSSLVDRKRLTAAAFETNQRMQSVADSVTDEFNLPPTKVGLKGNKFGVDDISKVDEDAFIGKVLEKQRRWKEPEIIGEMTDMSRGRFDVDSFDEATAIAESLESRFTKAFGSDNVDVTPPRDVYKRYHILVRDPQTGVWHEWQIGTNALTKFIEEVPVKLPKGVELHGDDFHVVMYDVLSKLDDPKVRIDHGLPDNIVDDIGLGALQKKYDALMVEAGTATKGAPEPIDFDVRLAELADELGGALENLERKHPGLATKLDTKLAADKAAKARAAAQPGSDGPAPKAKVDGGQGVDDSADKFWEADDFLGGKMDDAESAAILKEFEAEIATMNLSPEEVAKRKLQKGVTGLNNAPEEWLPRYIEIQRGVKVDGGDTRKFSDGFSDVWGHVSDGNARAPAEAAMNKVKEYRVRMANGEVATGKLHWSQYGDTPEAAVHSLRRLSKTYRLMDGKGGSGVPTARARAEVFDTLADWAEKTEGLAPGRRTAFPEGPAHQPDMPAANTTTKAATSLDGEQPKVRPEHESSVKYQEQKNAVAFAGEGAVNPHSAQQGALGDCYLLAGAAAEARANPAGVRRLIKDNGDGTFDVTLYFREDWWSDPVAKTVTVDGKLPTRGGAPVYAKVGQGENGEDEIWMALFEKALAKETGSYDLISGGNITKNTNFGGVHELLTGNKVKMVNTDSMGEDALLRRMSDALENKEPVAVGTYNFNDDATARVAAEKLNIYANHAYSIESVDLDARTVTLQNPWGSRHPTNVSIEDFRKYYKRLDIGTSAKSTGPTVGGEQFEGGGTGSSVLRGLSTVGDKVSIGVGRGSNAATALASSQTRNEASKELKSTTLGPGDIVFPGEGTRNQFWAHLTAADLVKFQGKLEGNDVVFFVAPSSQAVVISSLQGQYLTAFAAPSSLISHLLSQGEM